MGPGGELGSSGRAVCTLSHRVTLAALDLSLFLVFISIMKWLHIAASTPLYPHFSPFPCLLEACYVKIILLDGRGKDNEN